MNNQCPLCEGFLSKFGSHFICNDCNAELKVVKGKLKVIREDY